jgi:type IX secretion system PorP/SprF family membrane protein
VKRFAVIILALCWFSWAKGQDPHFTQFYANPLYLAPSFAGATEQDRFTLAYRNQWPELVSGVFVTYSFSYDHFFDKFNSGVGVLLMKDVAGTGDLGITNAGIQYSYDIKVTDDEFHLRPGIHFNYTEQGLRFDKLTWNDQLVNPDVPSIEQQPPDSKPDVDFAASLLGYGTRWWAGFAVDHLLRPNYGLYNNEVRWPIKYSAFGGYQIVKRSRLVSPIDETVSLAFYFRHQHLYTQLDMGLYWYKDPLMVGVWYRGIPFLKGSDDSMYQKDPRGDALAFLVGYKHDQIRVGYSYDFTISNLVSSTGGAHEVVLTWEFKTTRKKKRARMIPCPEF